MKISKKEIEKTIEQYNYICTTLRAMGKEVETVEAYQLAIVFAL